MKGARTQRNDEVKVRAARSAELESGPPSLDLVGTPSRPVHSAQSGFSFILWGSPDYQRLGTPESPRRNYKSHEALGREEVMTKPPRIGRAGRGAQAFSERGGGARGGASGGGSAGTPPRPQPPPRLAPPLLSLPGQRAGARRWRRRTIICSSCC